MLLQAAFIACFVGSSQVEIKFEAVSQSVRAGEMALFRAIAVNRGREPIYLVPQSDGMHSGKRSPVVQVQIRHVGGDWIVPTLSGCGNTDPLRSESFVLVKPGKSIDLLAGMEWSKHEVACSIKDPGVYEARFIFDTTAPFADWLGGPMAEPKQAELSLKLKPLYALVPKFKYTSPPARFRVTAN
jgi:hypothetical protein